MGAAAAKEVIAFPSGCSHESFRHGYEYQLASYINALAACGKRLDTAIDVGAHVGLWSKRMCNHFKRVIAIEPDSQNVECLEKNVQSQNLIIVRKAMHSRVGFGRVDRIEENSGASRAVMMNPYPVGDAVVSFDLIDNIDGLRDPDCRVDLLKIDVQGSLVDVLMGSMHTIAKHSPVVCAEMVCDQKMDGAAARLLEGIGYANIAHYDKDFVWIRKEPKA